MGRGHVAVFKNAVLGIREYFRQLTSALLIVLVAPYAIALAFVTSVGGMLQESAYGLLSSDAPSVYEAVYQDNITQLPTLGVWLLNGLTWPWLLCGALIATLAVPQRTLWKILLATAGAASAALVLVDLLTSGVRGALDARNIVGNLVGGPLAALVATPALLLFVELAGSDRPVKKPRLAVGAIAVAGYGACVCALAFFGFEIFFQPVAQKIDVVLARPVSGMSFAAVRSAGGGKSGRFSFLPDNSIGGEMDLNASTDGARVEWRSLRDEPFTVTATLIVDCGFTDLKAIPVGPALLVERGVSHVTARFDSQMTFVRTGTDSSASYDYRPSMPTSYWISDSGKDAVKITHFVSPEDPISVKLSSTTPLVVNGTMLRSNNGEAIPETHTLTLELGSKKVQIRFAKPRIDRYDRALRCHAEKPALVGTTFQSNEGTTVGGVLLRFAREKAPSLYSAQDAELRIRGGNGWLSIDKASIDALHRGELGKTGYLSFSGAIEGFRLDGKEVEHRKYDVFYAVGDLQASWIDEGKLKVAGSARQLWRGSDRLSPTMWERMPMEVKLALLSIVLGLSGMLELCRRKFLNHRNTDLAWLLS